VGPRARLDELEKRKFLTLPGLEFRPLGRPTRSQLLYRLSYPGPLLYKVLTIIATSRVELMIPCMHTNDDEKMHIRRRQPCAGS
jgi:hypothetical protein